MSDAELIAAASIIFAEAVEAMGENDIRKLNGDAPAYRDGSLCTDLLVSVKEELTIRIKPGYSK
jgi:hypothetical protein